MHALWGLRILATPKAVVPEQSEDTTKGLSVDPTVHAYNCFRL